MKRKRKLITWLVGGIILALGPIWGMLGTVIGMIQAFGHLAHADSQPEILANDISLALYTTAAGLIVFPFGIVIIIVSAIKLSKVRKEAEGIPNNEMQPTN